MPKTINKDCIDGAGLSRETQGDSEYNPLLEEEQDWQAELTMSVANELQGQKVEKNSLIKSISIIRSLSKLA